MKNKKKAKVEKLVYEDYLKALKGEPL